MLDHKLFFPFKNHAVCEGSVVVSYGTFKKIVSLKCIAWSIAGSLFARSKQQTPNTIHKSSRKSKCFNFK